MKTKTNITPILLLIAALTLTGCSGYRAAVKTALLSNYQPTIYLLTAAPSTNSIPAGAGLVSALPALPAAPTQSAPRSDQALTATATSAAPLIFCAEQINLMIFGGSASSNSVLTDIKLPLPGAL